MNFKKNLITISNVDLYYDECSDASEYGEYTWTEFYILDGLKPETKWSWTKFRKIPTGNMIDNFIFAFKLGFWITESTHLTKNELRALLERKFDRRVELVNRHNELKIGEFI